MMGRRRGAFLRGNYLHNRKVVGVGAESSPLVGTVGEVEGKSSYQTDGQRDDAPRARCAADILRCFLSAAHFICKTICRQTETSKANMKS